MFHLLQRHPFAVTAHFEQCLALTFACPAASLRPLLPPGLVLDTFVERETLGFVAIALVHTRALRPASWPTRLGGDFFLGGYRVLSKGRITPFVFYLVLEAER